MYYKKLGRIPWGKIADHPDHFLDKRSRPEADHVLQEPSRMTEVAINTWLKHWLTRQQRSKRPLILKSPSDSNDGNRKPPRVRKSSKKRIEWVEPDGEDQEDDEDEDDEDAQDERGTPDNDGNLGEPGDSPVTPAACATSRTSRRAFLATLSQDAKYQQLLLLLDAAKVSIFNTFGMSPD